MNEYLGFFTPPMPGLDSFRKTIDIAAEQGVTSLEILNCFEFETPDVAVAREMRAYADSRGVKFVCCSVCCCLVGENADEAIAMVKGYADVAAILGAPYLHHTLVCECNDPDAVLPYSEQYFAQCIRAVREIYDYAAERGVRAIYENQGYLFNGVENFRRFLAEVGRDVGVVADFGNIAMAGDNILDFIKEFAPRVCHAHLKDVCVTDDNPTGRWQKTLDGRYMHEVPLGTGDVPFGEGVTLLREAGYNGYYTLETVAADATAQAVTDLLDCASALMGA